MNRADIINKLILIDDKKLTWEYLAYLTDEEIRSEMELQTIKQRIK